MSFIHSTLTAPDAVTRRQWLVAALAGAGLLDPALAQSVRRDWPRGRRTPLAALTALAAAGPDPVALQGQACLVNFWASWCGPCRQEMRSLETAASRNSAAGLRVLAVNFREAEATVRRFVQETSLKLPVLRDGDGALARAFDVDVFPSTVAIGRDGRARFTVVGEHDWAAADAQQWIERLLR